MTGRYVLLTAEFNPDVFRGNDLNALTERSQTARQQVNDLNATFADWYYVITDEVYQNLHLGRSQIIRSEATGKQ